MAAQGSRNGAGNENIVGTDRKGTVAFLFVLIKETRIESERGAQRELEKGRRRFARKRETETDGISSDRKARKQSHLMKGTNAKEIRTKTNYELKIRRDCSCGGLFPNRLIQRRIYIDLTMNYVRTYVYLRTGA